MSLLGLHLTLLIGRSVTAPAPPALLDVIDTVEVTHSDNERSGFQITFRAPRDPYSFVDYPIVANPLLRPGNRVTLVVVVGAVPQVLFDGIITHQQLSPSPQPGSTTFAVTGEDVSVAMDREEKPVEHPAQPETVIALKIIASYPELGFVPVVVPPPSFEAPTPVDRTPVQRATDLGYLVQMAERYAYVFYVTPGPVPGTNTAYWGPPKRVSVPQRAITVDMPRHQRHQHQHPEQRGRRHHRRGRRAGPPDEQPSARAHGHQHPPAARPLPRVGQPGAGRRAGVQG